MEEQFAEMDQLLYAWNLPQLCAPFREQEITPDALDALTDTDIATLIPKLGPRALFRKRLHEWLEASQNSSLNLQQPQVEVESLVDDEQMEFSYVDEEENEVEVLSEVWLDDDMNVESLVEEQVNRIEIEDQNENYDKSDIDENVKEQKPSITKLEANEESQQSKTTTENPKRTKRIEGYKNLTKTAVLNKKLPIKKIGEIKQEVSQGKAHKRIANEQEENAKKEATQEISVSSSIERYSPVASTQRRCNRIGHNWAGLNVEELLLSTEAGRSLIENYESNPVLDKRARFYLADIIVTETFAKNLIMDRHKFDNIASQIVQLFPTEDKDSWYLAQKSSKKCSGGTLYYKYYATYTKMRRNGFYQHYVDSVAKHFDSDASLAAEIENSNYSVTLQDIGDDPEKIAFKRSIPRYERIRNSRDFQRINVKEVLEKSYEGLGIIDFYEKNNTLDVTTRNRLCKLVCMEGINRNIKMQPSDFYDISCQVVELFPNEKHEVFFFPRGKTPPKGCLYHKYIYLIRRMKKIGLMKKESVNVHA